MGATRAFRDAVLRRGAKPSTALPIHVIALFAAVEASTVISMVFAARGAAGGTRDWLVAGLLVVLAVLFEEGSRHVGRQQIRFGPELKRDMTSVWAVTAVVALPAPQCMAVIGVILCRNAVRLHLPAGQSIGRVAYSAASVMLACLIANAAVRYWHGDFAALPWQLGGSLVVLVGMSLCSMVNRVLVTLALRGLGVRGRILLGTREDNLIEFATLCLGGLASLAVMFEPWMAVFVIAPMFTLQRGAIVRELEQAATTDTKTGLLNALAWEHLAGRELMRARRDGTTLSVLIIDIDRFKLVNDRHGHLAGDEVLRGVGERISSNVREYDTVGRFGGEEFVAILPDVSVPAALVVAERVRAQVHALHLSHILDAVEPDDDRPMSVSVGVACFTPSTEADAGCDVADLVREADAALYEAKNAGRNRVVLAGGGRRASTIEAPAEETNEVPPAAEVEVESETAARADSERIVA